MPMQRSSTHSKNITLLKIKRNSKSMNCVSNEVISNIINFSKAYEALSQSTIQLNGVVLN